MFLEQVLFEQEVLSCNIVLSREIVYFRYYFCALKVLFYPFPNDRLSGFLYIHQLNQARETLNPPGGQEAFQRRQPLQEEQQQLGRSYWVTYHIQLNQSVFRLSVKETISLQRCNSVEIVFVSLLEPFNS